MPPKRLTRFDIRTKIIIISVILLFVTSACQSAISATITEIPPSSQPLRPRLPTVTPSVVPTVGKPTPTVTASPTPNVIVIKKITSDFVRDLNWDADLGQFVYAYYNPAKSPDPTRWESFDPAGGRQAVYLPKQVDSDDLKRRLGVYDDYLSIEPQGTNLLYLRVTETPTTTTRSLADESIEVWEADNGGLHPARLDEIPYLWDQVTWLAHGQQALLTFSYESVGSGIGAVSYDLKHRTSQKIFDSIKDLHGIPSSLAVSPDERWIALTTYGMGKDNSVWLVDRNSNTANRIDSAYSGAQPLWSKDSRSLYYLHSRTTYFPGTPPSESPYLARYDLLSQSIQPLTAPGDIAVPLISEWAVADDGKHFIVDADSGLGYLDQGLWALALNNR